MVALGHSGRTTPAGEPRSETPGVPDLFPEAPTEPPVIRRRLRFTRKQQWGLPVIFLVPLLAVAGVFGEREAEARAAAASLEVRVTYPARFRYRQVDPLRVRVRNVGTRTLESVHVAVDTAYIARFSGARFDPPPLRGASMVTLRDLAPGESRLVSTELGAERYGRHRGRVSVIVGTDTASAQLSTFVFP